MRRRKFLATMALVPAAASACKQKAGQPAPPARPAPTPEEDGCRVAARDRPSARVLSPPEWDALEAACERILPADEDAGARAAGVVNYIDAQLTHAPVSSLRDLLAAGARELDRLAAARGKDRFAALAEAEQDAILAALPAQRIGPHAGARFFEVLLVLTLEGFFGDPIYGGNRDGAGWKMIRFAPRSPGPRCAYRGA